MNPRDEVPADVAAEPAPANDYDAVTYPGAVYVDTTPARVAAVAMLAGLRPASPARCRVLELGCGDGMNVLAMAYGMPGSEFVGIDPAAQPIARGQAMAESLGMHHVSLRQMGVEGVTAEFGQFDYIIAHGLYSWVPVALQEEIMAVCGERLAANGVAFISYNAYPGYHLRELVRGMMLYHTAHYATPEEQIRQARGLVRFLAGSVKEGDLYQQVLAQQRERIAGYTDGGLFHDDLNVNNHPVYFHEFMAVAKAHGLRYVGEAELPAWREPDCPPAARVILDQLDPAKVVEGEQYRDFLRCRAFRQTLLCRQELQPERDLQPEAVEALYVGGEIRPASESAEVLADAPESFLGGKNSRMETDRPLVKAALRRLGKAWPQSMACGELLAEVRGDLGRVGDAEVSDDRQVLREALLEAALAGVVDLRAAPPQLVATPGDKPRASALARLQVERGDRVPTLLHTVVSIDNALGRTLLALLDGTRDRATLLAALEAAKSAPGMTPQEASAPVTEAALEVGLARLARLGLLEC